MKDAVVSFSQAIFIMTIASLMGLVVSLIWLTALCFAGLVMARKHASMTFQRLRRPSGENENMRGSRSLAPFEHGGR